jgi:putative spermidine/putrescine transport system substrate-binding protein
MIKRREFLIGISALGVGGCSLFADPQRLRILSLSGSLPSKVIGQFEKEFSKATELKAAKNPQELWEELKKEQEAEQVPQVMGLGDAWLDEAIAKKLIQPFSTQALAQITQWQKLAPRWQQLVSRNGQVWGIPYRWGTTAIAYRTDKLKFEINSWADLWRPELKRKLTLPNDSREVIGLVLKKLGHSYQTADLSAIPNLEAELKQLHDQVLNYTSDSYLQILLNDDSFAAVGWSQDMRKVQLQNPDQVTVVIPTDGTALWSDLWVLPAKADKANLPFAYNWMNFCLQPAIAAQITSLTDAATTSSALEQVPNNVKSDSIRFPAEATLAKSEVLLPLSESTSKQYQQLWTKITTSGA